MTDEAQRTNIFLDRLMSQFRSFGRSLDGFRDEVKQYKAETASTVKKAGSRFDKFENKVIDLICELSRSGVSKSIGSYHNRK